MAMRTHSNSLRWIHFWLLVCSLWDGRQRGAHTDPSWRWDRPDHTLIQFQKYAKSFSPLYPDSIVLPNGTGALLQDLPQEHCRLESLALEPATAAADRWEVATEPESVFPPLVPPLMTSESVGYYTWDPLNPPPALKQISQDNLNVETEVEVIPDEEDQITGIPKLEHDEMAKGPMKQFSGLLAMRFNWLLHSELLSWVAASLTSCIVISWCFGLIWPIDGAIIEPPSIHLRRHGWLCTIAVIGIDFGQWWTLQHELPGGGFEEAEDQRECAVFPWSGAWGWLGWRVSWSPIVIISPIQSCKAFYKSLQIFKIFRASSQGAILCHKAAWF